MRIVYLTDESLAISIRLAERNPNGALFRNSNGSPWTKDAVGCAFNRIQIRFGKQEMKQQELSVPTEEIDGLIPQLKPTKRSRGRVIAKTEPDLRMEAKTKLTNQLAASLAPRYSLYALRHSWATRALESGLDGLTVAVLMGHANPSTLAKVYQHLGHNPQHMLAETKRVSCS